jgi:SAM-dependent methyltransferase
MLKMTEVDMGDTPHNSRVYFDRLGGEWRSLQEEYFGPDLRDAALARALDGGFAVDTAVDLGTGNGFMLIGLAPLARRIIGVDQSAPMLAAARNYLAHAGITAVELVRGDAGSVPLPDGLADLVTANMYLHHCPDPAAAIAEAARLLRRGGRLVITDLERHEHFDLMREWHDAWPGFEAADVEAWFGAAGFRGITIERIERCSCTSGGCEGGGVALPVFCARAERK